MVAAFWIAGPYLLCAERQLYTDDDIILAINKAAIVWNSFLLECLETKFDPFMFLFLQPSQKAFRIKKKLGKKANQNRLVL